MSGGQRQPSVEEAKLRLMRESERANPAHIVRKRPWTTVLVAAGVGILLGASPSLRKSLLRNAGDVLDLL